MPTPGGPNGSSAVDEWQDPILGFAILGVRTPVSDRAVVGFRMPVAGPLRLGVFDVTGRRLLSSQVTSPGGTGEVRFDVSSLPAGVYLLRLEARGRLRSGRLVVAR